MDKNALIVLTADLTAQMAVVKSISLLLTSVRVKTIFLLIYERIGFTANEITRVSAYPELRLLLEERAIGLRADDPVRLESVAYQLHNFYNAIEDLLKMVAAHFENQISDTARWHSVLLQRMSQEIPGIRPVVLSQESYLVLNSLRGFRHFFRHAYGVPIDYEQLQINLNKARQLYPNLEKDLNQFFAQLQ